MGYELPHPFIRNADSHDRDKPRPSTAIRKSIGGKRHVVLNMKKEFLDNA